MLQPKRTKFRKEHRGRMKGMAIKGSTVAFGEFGLKSMGSGWVTSRQIEAGRRAITRHLRRGGQVWIRIFPAKPITHKPLETRQGGGKGPPRKSFRCSRGPSAGRRNWSWPSPVRRVTCEQRSTKYER